MQADFRRAGGHSPQNTLTMIGTKRSKVYVVGGKEFTDLTAAKQHALELTLGDVPAATEVMAHADAVLAILSQKPWKPRTTTPAATPAA